MTLIWPRALISLAATKIIALSSETHAATFKFILTWLNNTAWTSLPWRKRIYMPTIYPGPWNSPTLRGLRSMSLMKVVQTGRTDLDHRSEEHTSELQSRFDLVIRLLL